MFRLVRFSAQIRLLMFILEIVHRAAGEVNVSGFESLGGASYGTIPNVFAFRKLGWSILLPDSKRLCMSMLMLPRVHQAGEDCPHDGGGIC